MKDSDYVMYLWNEIEMRRKEKEARKKMTQNQNSDVDCEGKKGKEKMQNQNSDVDSEGKKGKEMMQNQKSDVDSDGKKGKDQHSSVEKTVLDKGQKKDINEEAAKPGVTIDNVDDNAGISVSSGPKSVHESADEPAREDVGTPRQQNDVVQSPSQAKRQKLADEDVGISDQQNDVAQEKRQKAVERRWLTLTKVRNLKERIAILNGIPIEQQHLIYSGRVLQDDQLLSSYHIQNGDTLYLVCAPESVSSFGSLPSRPGASRTLGASRPNSLQILPPYLDRMRREYSTNETGNDKHEVLRSILNTFTPSLEEIPRAEQLARLLSSTRDMLINQTSQRLLELEGDLRHNLNVADPRIRYRTQSNAQKSGRIFNKLGAYFLELARTMMQVEMGHSRRTATVNVGHPLYITDDLRPNPLSIQQGEGATFVSTTSRQINLGLVNSNGTEQAEMIRAVADARSLQTLREIILLLPRLLRQTISYFSVEDPTESFQNMPSQHQHEQPSASIRQKNNTELTDVHGEELNRNLLSPSRDDFIPDGDIHVEEAATPGATTENVTKSMGTGVSAGPSAVEYRSAHELSIETSAENIGTSLQQDDVAQSQPQTKRQKME